MVVNSQCFASDLDHLRVKSLTHFNSSVSQQDWSVRVNLKKCCKKKYINLLKPNLFFFLTQNIVFFYILHSHISSHTLTQFLEFLHTFRSYKFKHFLQTLDFLKTQGFFKQSRLQRFLFIFTFVLLQHQDWSQMKY